VPNDSWNALIILGKTQKKHPGDLPSMVPDRPPPPPLKQQLYTINFPDAVTLGGA